MDETELEEVARCADCGSEITAGIDRGFSSGTDLVLCYDCAERRGGAWDEARGVWTRAPDLIGLQELDPAER